MPDGSEARISRTEPDGIVVTTDAGIEKIPFAKMTEEQRAAFAPDMDEAARYAAELARQKQAVFQAGQEAAAREHAEKMQQYQEHARNVERVNAERRAMQEKATHYVSGSVVWVRDGMVLVDGGTREAADAAERAAEDRRRERQRDLDWQNIAMTGMPSLGSVGGGGGGGVVGQSAGPRLERVVGFIVVKTDEKEVVQGARFRADLAPAETITVEGKTYPFFLRKDL